MSSKESHVNEMEYILTAKTIRKSIRTERKVLVSSSKECESRARVNIGEENVGDVQGFRL